MRKIPPELENPLDNLSISLADALCPLFKKLHFTPNGITFLSLIFGLISLWALWNYNMVVFSITYYISYFFDCMDGHYARKYSMQSKFGDMFDHGKDILVNLSLIGILMYRYKTEQKIKWQVITMSVIISCLMVAHLGCQERIYQSDESPSLSFSQKLCVGDDPSSTIRVTRYFGCGTWAVFVIILVLYINHNREV